MCNDCADVYDRAEDQKALSFFKTCHPFINYGKEEFLKDSKKLREEENMFNEEGSKGYPHDKCAGDSKWEFKNFNNVEQITGKADTIYCDYCQDIVIPMYQATKTINCGTKTTFYGHKSCMDILNNNHDVIDAHHVGLIKDFESARKAIRMIEKEREMKKMSEPTGACPYPTPLASNSSDHIVEKVDYVVVGKKTTVCLITTIHGFEVIGTSACIDPDDFNVEEGRRRSLSDAQKQLDLLHAYYRTVEDY
jgi:hypothetical protein